MKFLITLWPLALYLVAMVIVLRRMKRGTMEASDCIMWGMCGSYIAFPLMLVTAMLIQ